ncbi:MAG TPA: hypothetical protein VEQ10_15395 [Vicinamibacteria bacterium]|nr:hypothetical protein [Vicinamibacteria bacterium]
MFRVPTVAIVLVTASVAGAGEAGKARPASSAFTLGLVQRELRAGLSQTEVVEKLGSPNLLTRDGHGREAWVYDKVSSEFESSGHHLGVAGVGSGAGASVGGILGLSAGRHAEKESSSQRTLTVVVRFSEAGLVETFSWRDSRF